VQARRLLLALATIYDGGSRSGPDRRREPADRPPPDAAFQCRGAV